MGFLSNNYRDKFNAGRLFGVTGSNGGIPSVSFANTYRSNALRNIFAGEAGIEPSASIPNGVTHPVAWQMPQVAGGMSMRTTGSGELVGDLIPTRPMTVDITGSGTLAATAGLAVSMTIDMDGTGTLTADILGIIAMSVDFTGMGELDAAIEALANMTADLVGSGDLDATISGIADMELDIVVTGTGLTLQNVSIAVWEALATNHNTAGTMGEKLNDAGSAGNPWASLLVDNTTVGSFGEFVQALSSASEISVELLQNTDLCPGYTVQDAMRLMLAALAGKVSGAGTNTVRIRDINDTKDRITATVDSSGNRTALIVDPS